MHRLTRLTLLILWVTTLTLGLAHEVQSKTPSQDPVMLSASNDAGISLQLSFPLDKLAIETLTASGMTWSQLSLEGWDTLAEPGTPSLLMQTYTLGVPFGVTVDVHVQPGKSYTRHLSEPLIPAPKQQITWPLTAEPKSGFPNVNYVIEKDQAVYTSSEAFPTSLAIATNDGVLRQQRVIGLRVAPMQYDPLNQNLILYENLQVKITFQGDQLNHTQSQNVESRAFENVLAATLLNYESAKQWRSSSPSLHGMSSRESIRGGMPWTLPDPAWRITTREEGMHYLSYANLNGAGVPVGSLVPDSVQIFHLGTEIAIQFVDLDDDSVFDPEDGFIFFAEAVRTKYTDENAYWFTHGNVTQGSRMAVLDGAPGGAPTPGDFMQAAHFEENHKYISGAEGDDDLERYLWTSIFASGDNPKSWEYTFDLTAPSDGSGSLTVRLLGYTSLPAVNPDHHVRIFVNDTELTDAETYWDGYTFETAAGTIPPGTLTSGENTIKITLPHDTGSVYEIVYVDWMAFDYPSSFQADQDALTFSYPEGTWLFNVQGFSANDLRAYDISDPHLVAVIDNGTITQPDSTYSFQFQRQIPAAEIHTYSVLDTSAFKVPQSIDPISYASADLSTENGGADYILITHGDFYAQAQTLAAHRQAQGWRTVMVDVQQVYDQFGYGVTDVQAIKNFLTFAYGQWAVPAPSFVVLLGDGHYDPLNYEGYGRESFIPPYLAFADPGLGETAADNRYVTVEGGDALPDMMLGRLAVNNVAEAGAFVEKLISYDDAPLTNPGPWQRQLLAVAGASDKAGNFPVLSDQVFSETVYLPYAVQKIYYKISHQTLPGARTELFNAVNTGKIFVNFIGHGFTNGWTAKKSTNEIFLTTADKGNFNNLDMYPIILAMTCWEGYYIHPFELGSQEAMGEVITKLSDAGAVASWSPSGLGVAQGHDQLNKGFYAAIFQEGFRNLGGATQAGKLRLWTSGIYLDLLDTYLLLGDPATPIALDFTAVHDNYTMYEDNVLSVNAPAGVLANEIHPTNASLTADLVEDVSHGDLTFNADGSFLYTPEANYNGSDSFTYRANDGVDDSNISTANITIYNVNDPPVANPQEVSTNEDQALEITLTGSDVDGDDLTFKVEEPPLNGDLSGSGADLTYTPHQDYYGEDLFTFSVSDVGSISALTVDSLRDTTAAVAITIRPVNDAPFVDGIPDQIIKQPATFTVVELDNYVSDVDNALEELTWTFSGNSKLIVEIHNHLATISAPSSEWTGLETITFIARDPGGLSDSDQADFTVNAPFLYFYPLFTR